MTGAAIVFVLIGFGGLLAGYASALIFLAVGLAVLIVFDGDSDGGGA